MKLTTHLLLTKVITVAMKEAEEVKDKKEAHALLKIYSNFLDTIEREELYVTCLHEKRSLKK